MRAPLFLDGDGSVPQESSAPDTGHEHLAARCHKGSLTTLSGGFRPEWVSLNSGVNRGDEGNFCLFR